MTTSPSHTRRFHLGSGPDELTIYATFVPSPPTLLLHCAKPGSLERGLLRLLSLAFTGLLSAGVPLSEIISMLRHHDFGPSGLCQIGGQSHFVRSAADALGIWLEGVAPKEVTCPSPNDQPQPQ